MLLGTWGLGVTFLLWKHAFVRADLYHTGFLFGCVPVLAMTFKIIPSASKSLRVAASGLALLCCSVCLATVQSMIIPGDLNSALLQPYRSIAANFAKLVNPSTCREQIQSELDVEQSLNKLPKLSAMIGSKSVDMFGFSQAAVLLNGLNYTPRPVFQSYAAYNAPLALLNQEFYLSKSAPHFVLFQLVGMDRKFPPLEDALLLRHLLINFVPEATEGPFLLLKSKSAEPARLKLLREGTARPSQQIDLAGFGDSDLWMEVNLEPTLIGGLKQFFYQSSKVRLVLWHGPPEKRKVRRFRAPPPMLRAGFLVSPLQLNNDDVLNCYRGEEIKRPVACAIELNPGTENSWREIIRFRLYKIENRLGRSGTAAFSESPGPGEPGQGSP